MITAALTLWPHLTFAALVTAAWLIYERAHTTTPPEQPGDYDWPPLDGRTGVWL